MPHAGLASREKEPGFAKSAGKVRGKDLVHGAGDQRIYTDPGFSQCGRQRPGYCAAENLLDEEFPHARRPLDGSFLRNVNSAPRNLAVRLDINDQQRARKIAGC